jgi:hypothetical protein
VRYHTDAGLCSSLVYAQGCGPELKIVNRTPFEVDHVFPKMAGTQTHDLDALGPTAIISPAHDHSLDFGQASAQHYDVRFTLNAKTRRPINVTFQNDGLCHFHYLDPIFDKAGLNLAVHD